MEHYKILNLKTKKKDKRDKKTHKTNRKLARWQT